MTDIRKAAIIGCGFVGSTTAFALMQTGVFSDLVLIDANPARAEGEAMDLSHGLPFAHPMKITAGTYDDIGDCALIIITAGASQRPGETRLDLVQRNVAIFRTIIPAITQRNREAVLLIVSLIIISNTIKLAMFDRREEIAIMRMVGATNGFIRLPFVVEGFILGLLGAVCSFFLEWGLYEAIRGAIASSGQLSFLHVVSFSTVVLPVALVCVVTGLLIGVVGSLMSIRKFLKV